MTAYDLLITCREAGILLVADGDGLVVDAPAGALTPELRDQLTRSKTDLLALLAPVEFVSLRGGLVVPAPALLLALDLERRGFRMWLDQDQQFQIDQPPALSEADRVGIDRWRLDLGAVIGYDADAQGRTQ